MTGLLKPPHGLHEAPSFNNCTDCLGFSRRILLLKHSAPSAVGLVIVLLVYLKADTPRRINTWSDKRHRNSSGGIQGGHRLDGLNANRNLNLQPRIGAQISITQRISHDD